MDNKMEKKLEQEQLKALQKQIADSGHGKPVTRRELLGQGLISGGAFVIAPSLLGSIYAQSSMAQEAIAKNCPSDDGTKDSLGAIVVELAGGGNLAGGNVWVGGRGGQKDRLPPGSYKSISIGTEPMNLVNRYGLDWNPGSATAGFLKGMDDGIKDAAVREKVKGILYCSTSENDTNNNSYIPTHQLVHAGAMGELAKLVGTGGGLNGARSNKTTPFIEPGLTAVAINRASDATALVAKSDLARTLGEASVNKIMKATALMGNEALCNLSRRSLSEQMAAVCGCRYDKSLSLATKFGVDGVDPGQDQGITSAYTDQARGAEATIAKLVVNGLAGVGVIVKGGYDYHGRTKAQTDAMDLAAGLTVGRIIAYAASQNRPVTIMVVTDGGVSANTTGWAGDSSGRSAALQFSFHPNGVQVQAGKDPQIGAYKQDGTVDKAVNAIGDNTTNLALAFTANYLALKGDEKRLTTLFGANPISQKLEEYLVFSKSV